MHTSRRLALRFGVRPSRSLVRVPAGGNHIRRTYDPFIPQDLSEEDSVVVKIQQKAGASASLFISPRDPPAAPGSTPAGTLWP